MNTTAKTAAEIAANVPFGLFDLPSYWDLVNVICSTLELRETEVHEKLFGEACQTGSIVRKDAESFGVMPHVFDGRMEAFYAQTNAFVFELLVAHLNPYCQEIDRRIAHNVAVCLAGREDSGRLLLLGDGIGTDSLRFAVAGYQPTYFEFAGPSAVVAKCRFGREGQLDRIECLHSIEAIPENCFDVVVCREVLEHVNDPPAVIENIWRYLRPNGTAIITESFRRVEPWFPTHLESNRRYDGLTEKMFVHSGFYLSESSPDKRPLVFRKTSRSDANRFASLPSEPHFARVWLTRAIRRLRNMARA